MAVRIRPEERISLIEHVPSYRSEVEVKGWNVRIISLFISRSARGDFWYFGKPTAYADRRMGLAVAFREEIEEARRKAEVTAHFAGKQIFYGES